MPIEMPMAKPVRKFEKKKVDPNNPTGLTEADYLAAEARMNPKPKVEAAQEEPMPAAEATAESKPGYKDVSAGELRQSERFKTTLAEAIDIESKPDPAQAKEIARLTAALKRNEQAAKQDAAAAETARKIKAKLEELKRMM